MPNDANVPSRALQSTSSLKCSNTSALMLCSDCERLLDDGNQFVNVVWPLHINHRPGEFFQNRSVCATRLPSSGRDENYTVKDNILHMALNSTDCSDIMLKSKPTLHVAFLRPSSSSLKLKNHPIFLRIGCSVSRGTKLPFRLLCEKLGALVFLSWFPDC